MNEDISPYNAHEIARAKSIMSMEVNRNTFKFLERRVKKFANSHKKFSQNLWEGGEGRMEHITNGFPMPLKMQPKYDDSVSGDGPSKTPNTETHAEEIIPSKPTCTHSEINRNSSPPRNETEDGMHTHVKCEKDPSTSNSCENGKSIDSPSNSSGAVLSKGSNSNHKKRQEKDFICVSVSNTERKHWSRLSDLQKHIRSTQKDLASLRSRFKTSKNETACHQMESLHWTIHGLITALTEEKRVKDKNNFRLVNSQEPIEAKESLSSRITPQSYSKTWFSLKRLCSKFKNVWNCNRSVLSKFTSLDNIPHSKLQARLRKIVLKDS